MRTMEYLGNEHFMGFVVDNVNDAMKAHEIGLDLITENGDVIGYDVEDEDGNERPMTNEEICQDIIKALEVGTKLYAGNYLGSETVVTDRKATMLVSNFYVGQKVFFLLENKIVEGTITQLNLTVGKDEENHFRNICERIYDRIKGYVSPNVSVIPFRMLSNDAQEVVRTSIKDVVSSDRAVISYVTQLYGTSFTISIPLSDVFATKEELVKHLMED